MIEKELPKNYIPADYEDLIYAQWEKSGFFNPDNLDLPKNAKTYTIILPPPNITDRLHLGHSAMLAIEDLLIRYHRLKGERTLWLPGTDHAPIATQYVVEKKLLKEEKKTRHDYGREEFLKKVWEFLKITQTTILHQTRKMGASLDWSRQAFTFDEPRSRAVNKLFTDMYREGVIYRGIRVVNWCPRCQSTLADDEVEYKEEKGKLYWLKYGPFVLATSRPETKLGDTAVAVYPGDKRYKKMVGKNYMIKGVLGEFEITVVADRAVDPKFGSGAIKVTPAHDFTDYEIAQRHKLGMKQVINEQGRMMANTGKYAGLTTKEAREAIVSDMEKMGLLDHIEDGYTHNLAVCYRCGNQIEPIPSKQWFVNVDKKLARLGDKSLKEKAIEAANPSAGFGQAGQIEFIPERFKKRYLDWMNNLHDWCVSRQIWFGHRIPVWYRGAVATGEQKKMGFHSSIVPELLAGKRRTYRLRDHELAVGDRVVAEDSGVETTLGYLTITGVQKLTVGTISLPDMIHSGKYKTTPELIAAFKRMHPEKNDINENTPAFIYDYDFSPLTKEDLKNSVLINYFVHGTTTDNEQKKRTGWHDGVLSNLGKKQNLELKETLRKRGDVYDIVFTSDLKRAKETAEIVFGDYKTDKRLRECNYGDLNGQPEAKFKDEKYYINNPHPNGESYKDVEKRVKEFLSEIAEKYRGKKIAIVSHMFPQLALEVILKNKTWEQTIDEDWRKKEGWQAGWKHEIKNSPAADQEIYVGEAPPEGAGWTQDPDTLDTWFSSGTWTFSTLGWPDNFVKGKKIGDLARFHPTQVLETGYEIITLWVSRMIIMSFFALNEIPFEKVYLHGMILDKEGKKMSKSKGNGIDPLEMIEKYGTDAVRLSLLMGSTPGNDARVSEEKIQSQRNFVNKLWNVARFIIQTADGRKQTAEINMKNLTLADKWILGKFRLATESVTAKIESYEFSSAGEILGKFTWDELADWYLEISKFEKNKEKNKILDYILENLLKLWHPFMPFVTEVIWQEMGKKNLLMVEKWPAYAPRSGASAGKPTNDFEMVKEIIIAIRNARAENRVEPVRKVKAVIYAGKRKKIVEEQSELIKSLRTGVGELEILAKGEKLPNAIYAAVGEIEIYLIGAVDETKEKARLEREIANLEKIIASTTGRLANKEFTAKAPAEIVKKEKAKLAGWQAELKKFREQMGNL